MHGCRAIALAAGHCHNLAVSQTGAVYSWGDGSFGKLGHGVSTHLHGVSTHLHGVSTHLHGVSTHLHGVSTHLHGVSTHLDAPARIRALAEVRVAQVAAGRRHSLAVSTDGRAYVWGFADETLLNCRQPAPQPSLPGISEGIACPSLLGYCQPIPPPQLPYAEGGIARPLSVCEFSYRQTDPMAGQPPPTTPPAFQTVPSPPLLGPPPFHLGGVPPPFCPGLTPAVAPVGNPDGWRRA
jgi:hypothetical protein